MNRRQFLGTAAAGILAVPALLRNAAAQEGPFPVKYFPIDAGVGLHDVTPARDGAIWFTGQRNGTLGRLDPRDGAFKLINLGKGASPHGVVIGPDGAPWVTEGGQNAIARVDPSDHKVTLFRLPEKEAYANLNTGVFDKSGIYWFTGQSGIYGRLDPKSGDMTVFKAPRGVGPYGITATPKGEVWYASLAGNHIAKIELASGRATVVEPSTPKQGARRVWSDSKSRIWVSEWNSGQVSVHDPADSSWRSWKLPGSNPRAYAVYVDDKDKVWLTDFSANAIVRFDPVTEKFNAFPSDKSGANVRQLDGRPGEIWGAESGNDRLVVIQTAA
ncbi:Vgb family protein [Bradyrhizobium australiense]|uniref:Virginiamycin B lyase n=1 Tax=Bradyrhizobium australiense TaxID=2721161 RepID=A0A7Y4GWF0_9BRAD|nr:lyase [Bradyrhizobium australiense]NOJ43220.1 lyase [Bradyrhizobium australiense]